MSTLRRSPAFVSARRFAYRVRALSPGGLAALLLVIGLPFAGPRAAETEREEARSAASAGESERPLFRATSTRSFHDVEHWVSVFDDPERDAWQKPERVVETLGLRPGSRVADLGAGTGYFVRHLARAVGERGRVFALEVEPALVAHLRERAEREGAANVIPVLTSYDRARLPRESIDLVLIVDTFHHIDARLGYFQRLREALAADGRVAVIDWRKQPLPEGPPPAHKLAREQVIEEMKAAGYRLAAEFDFLPYQYFLVFSPQG